MIANTFTYNHNTYNLMKIILYFNLCFCWFHKKFLNAHCDAKYVRYNYIWDHISMLLHFSVHWKEHQTLKYYFSSHLIFFHHLHLGTFIFSWLWIFLALWQNVMFLYIKSSTINTCKRKWINVMISYNDKKYWVTTWNIDTIFEHQKKHLNEVVKVNMWLK